MTVYVDDMKAKFKPKHRPDRTYVMSHMIADTEAELHAMAAAIGVARRWYQGDHYDITQSAKAKAIAAGAVAITWRQCSAMSAFQRAGRPMPTPDKAIADLTAVWSVNQGRIDPTKFVVNEAET